MLEFEFDDEVAAFVNVVLFVNLAEMLVESAELDAEALGEVGGSCGWELLKDLEDTVAGWGLAGFLAVDELVACGREGGRAVDFVPVEQAA